MRERHHAESDQTKDTYLRSQCVSILTANKNEYGYSEYGMLLSRSKPITKGSQIF